MLFWRQFSHFTRFSGLFWINFCFYLTKQNIDFQEKREWSNPILSHDFLQLCIHPVQQQQQQNQCFQESYISSYTPMMICNLNNTVECNLFKKCKGKNKSELTQVHTNFKLYPKHTQLLPSPSYSTNPHELQKSRLSHLLLLAPISHSFMHMHTQVISLLHISLSLHTKMHNWCWGCSSGCVSVRQRVCACACTVM